MRRWGRRGRRRWANDGLDLDVCLVAEWIVESVDFQILCLQNSELSPPKHARRKIVYIKVNLTFAFSTFHVSKNSATLGTRTHTQVSSFSILPKNPEAVSVSRVQRASQYTTQAFPPASKTHISELNFQIKTYWQQATTYVSRFQPLHPNTTHSQCLFSNSNQRDHAQL